MEKYKTDVTDMQGIFRIIRSIPSPKAEPFKMWLEIQRRIPNPRSRIGIGVQCVHYFTKNADQPSH